MFKRFKKNTLSSIRAAVIDYYKNPAKYMDMSTLRPHYDGSYIVDGKSFAEVSGLEKLGNGAYADVYAIDDARALKIVKKKDTGYARFVQICLNNPSNPHLPKIYYQGEWGGKQVYVMERLKMEADRDKCNSWGESGIKSDFRAAINYGSANPFFAHANEHIAMLAKLAKEHNWNDMHDGNIMFRGNTPVVTDPSVD
jgi:hypothetical protein